MDNITGPHLKHIYGPKIDINSVDVFTMMNEHSYAAFIGVLSNIYMKAHASSPHRTAPYRAVLIISPSMTTPYKGQPESSAERLQAIIKRMIAPHGNIMISIYVSNKTIFSKDSKVGLKHTVSQSWPLNNSKKSKEHITLNLPSKQLNKNENIVRYFTYDVIKPALEGHRVLLMDYYKTIADIFDMLERSKVHLCYQGGTAWLSISMGIPTLIIHPQPGVSKLHLKHKLFGQDLGNINILQDELITHVRTHPLEHHVHIKNLKAKLGQFV